MPISPHRRVKRRGAGRPRRGAPGRPAAPEGADADARRRLLDSAARQFAESGYSGTSLRAVAGEAGVTPAMVAYYFKGKWGLLEAVLIEGFEHILAELERAMKAQDTSLPPLQRFVTAELEALTSHPWMPRIIVQEVLSRDTPLRELFVERFASRALQLGRPLLQAEVEAGRLRKDLDPRLVLLSVIGMCVFPFLAQPLLGPLLGYRIDEAFAAEFIPHTRALLAGGLEVRQ